MLALNKIAFTVAGASKFVMKAERVRTILALSNVRKPVLEMLSNITTSSMNLKKKEKEEHSKLVLLSSSTYKAADVEEDTTVPVIILHGLLGSKANWNTMCRALHLNTKKRTIIAVDSRNHGDSPHTDEFSYEIMVADLVHFMRYKGITKASFIGHSLGGRVVMLLSLLYPQLVHSLVIVDISPLGHSPKMLELPKLFTMIKNLDLHPLLTLKEARKRAGKQLKKQLKDEKLVNFLLTNLDLNTGNTNWRWKFNLESISKNFLKEVCCFPMVKREFKGRTMFIAGRLSDYIEPKSEPAIKRVFPAAKFVYVPGAGHWVHAEKPLEFLAVVADFLLKDPRY